jgi:ribonuclease P protein component
VPDIATSLAPADPLSPEWADASAFPTSSTRGIAMTIHLHADPRGTAPGPELQRQSLAGARLCKHADYQRAYAAARKRQSGSMSWFLALQSGSIASPRVGLTAGKVLGKAHERNRIKRRMREILRHHLDLLPQGCDLILHPRRVVLTMEFTKLDAEVVRILRQANGEASRMMQPAPSKPTV